MDMNIIIPPNLLLPSFWFSPFCSLSLSLSLSHFPVCSLHSNDGRVRFVRGKDYNHNLLFSSISLHIHSESIEGNFCYKHLKRSSGALIVISKAAIEKELESSKGESWSSFFENFLRKLKSQCHVDMANIRNLSFKAYYGLFISEIINEMGDVLAIPLNGL